MQYANGREVKAGDGVLGMDPGGRPIGGIVCDVFPDKKALNIGVIALGAGFIAPCTSSDCLHVEDVTLAGQAMKQLESIKLTEDA